ncbi:P-loop containing nucleoside triphosphate hydrolase protein [Flammula alnicola]|nr:P-loop containing nucleoside triphosphate hydrolase protein [Flammula alnicola]
MSSTYEAYAESLMKRKSTVDAKNKLNATVTEHEHEEEHGHELEEEHQARLSFPALGFDSGFVRALQTAFPNVNEPTAIQEKLIPEILSGKDILLRDATGSGKSFGLVLGLLNKPRIVIHDESADGPSKRRVVTTLFIVPHRDLALQLLHWIERLTSALTPAIKELRETPPHILISTPQALMEVYKEDRDALQLSTLSTVVVDEVDYLVETAARKEEGKKLEKHPGPTREILDVIYAKRKALSSNPYDPDEDENGEYESVAEWRNEKEEEERNPQLILSSATLRVHLKDYLFGDSGWLNPYNLVKIMGDTASARRSAAKSNRQILHSVLVVSDTEIKNVEGAVTGPEEEPAEAAAAEESAEEEEDGTNPYYNEKYGRTPSPFNPNALEGIATAFALDVPSIALLVIPSSSPVQRAVYELREMGVNAEGLDLQIGERGGSYLLKSGVDVVRENPRLLVATLATTRGLDLPELSHVFVLGIPEGPKVNGRSVDAYVHIAGRVGRFGRRGRVVSVVEDTEESAKLERILKTIGERAVRFEHFD